MNSPPQKNGTLARSHADGLTLDQQSAVDLLAAGKNDTETAAALNVNRVTVTRWRCYSPEFRAALAARRAEVWGAAADRLRALIPTALDAVADALADDTNPDRARVALALLRLVGPLPVAPTAPTDPAEYVRREVETEIARTPTAKERFRDRVDGLPSYEERTEAVRTRLTLLATDEAT